MTIDKCRLLRNKKEKEQHSICLNCPLPQCVYDVREDERQDHRAQILIKRHRFYQKFKV